MPAIQDADPRGWSDEKVQIFKAAFYEFLNHVEVNSKELGPMILGEHLYRAQHRFFDGVFDGLKHGQHDFKHLKSRQIGISTGSRALTLFWVGMHAGLKGYMVFDTDPHKEEARLELIAMIRSLPASVKFPRIKRENRNLVELDNGSIINFASAGVKSSKSSGTLGRSSGVNFVHASEMCSWENVEGLEAFRNALAEDFPNRLYIWESTARGFNQWHEMWSEARKDSAHQVCMFSGWWAKDNQIIRRTDADFERYGIQPPTKIEAAKIKEVEQKYGWKVTQEQLAWYRRKVDPTAKPEGDAPAEFEASSLRIQEQPWTEEEAFQQTGSSFFDPLNLTNISNKFVNGKFKTYSYSYGTEFHYLKAYPAPNARSVELKVWTEPEAEGGVYIVGSDVAFGANEKNDRSAIQVLRAYSDGLTQVAEYASPLINSRQFAWVIASLLAWYAGDKNDVYNILEINGPGEATWNELQSLKSSLQFSYNMKEVEERGLRQIFTNVRNYVYTRSDSMSSGHNYQWKTNPRLKVTILERLRDFVSNEMLWIRSADTIDEMRSMIRSGEDGDQIAAQGRKKDDRILAMAFAVRYWDERVRKILMASNRTRENEAAKKRLTIRDQASMYSSHMLENLFAVKRIQRNREMLALNRRAWRGR